MRRILLFMLGAFASSSAATAQATRLPGADIRTPRQKPVPVVVSDFEGAAPGTNTPWSHVTSLAPDVTFSGWDHGPGSQGFSGIDDALGFFVSAPSSGSDFAQALADGAYLTCSLQPAAGRPMRLSGARITFDIARLQWHAPRQYALFSSVDGFQAGQELFTTPYIESGDFGRKSWAVFLPDDARYSGLTSTVEFRLYAFEANFAGHDTSLAAFRLETNVAHHRLDLTTTGGGSAWLDPPGPVFTRGDKVRLFAQPDTGYRFSRWRGNVKGLGNPREIVIERDLAVLAQFDPVPADDMSVGINIDWANNKSTAWPFIDLFQRARPWWTRSFAHMEEVDSGYTDLMQTDADGWPTVVPFDPGTGELQFVHTELTVINEPGAYTFHYEGSGTLRLTYDGGPGVLLPTPGTPQSHSFFVAPGAVIGIAIEATNAAPNHLKNFSLVHDLFAGSTERFHPLFLQRLQDFAPLRFMDWGETNGSRVVQWSDRTRPEHYTQALKSGVSWEIVIELANELGVDPWICVPHLADDDYVRQLARLFRDQLDPELRVHVEYSNETWNGSAAFTQSTHVRERGVALGLDPDPIVAGHMYTGLRSARIWHLFAEEFGPGANARIVNVLATHLAGFQATENRIAGLQGLARNPHARFPEVLAIAPYFGHAYGQDDIPPQTASYPSVDEILDVDALQSIAALRSFVADHKRIANEQGYQLVCYEGGQHYSAENEVNDDLTLVQLLHDANRDPRMGVRYAQFLDMLKDEGVELLANYSFCRAYSEFGSWAIMERINQPRSEAPKYDALLDWIANN